MIAADAECAVIFPLSPGQAGDAPEADDEDARGAKAMRCDNGQGV